MTKEERAAKFAEGKAADAAASKAYKALKAKSDPIKKSKKVKIDLFDDDQPVILPTKSEPVDMDLMLPDLTKSASRAKAMSNYVTSPTLESAETLQTAFNYFNERLFGGLLPPTIVRLQTDKKSAGNYSPERFSRLRNDVIAVDEITLNPDTLDGRDDKKILSTLVHEMCHAEEERLGDGPMKWAHTKKFREIMGARGLDVVICNAKGNRTPDKLTGRNATHDIMPGGPFDTTCDELFTSGYELRWLRRPIPAAMTATRKKKPPTVCVHRCPDCDEVAKAKIAATLVCGSCDVGMVKELPEASED